jgi:transglutaminase-like putative cysteine protease
MMSQDKEVYLQPSELCDFDQHPEIRRKALELTSDCQSEKDRFQNIFAFVKELLYGLEDWDVRASETLSKGWGMCSGKTNLLVAMLRSVGIPARYRVFRIKGEIKLWEWAIKSKELSQLLGTAPLQQNHVDCEVWLGAWLNCDPSRDTPLERGMLTLGIPLEREPLADESGRIYTFLSSFDKWAKERQQKRRFRDNRDEIFTIVNERFQQIRALGKGGYGIEAI